MTFVKLFLMIDFANRFEKVMLHLIVDESFHAISYSGANVYVFEREDGTEAEVKIVNHTVTEYLSCGLCLFIQFHLVEIF